MTSQEATELIKKIDKIRDTDELLDTDTLVAQGYRIACDRIIKMLVKEHGGIDIK